MSKLKRVYTDFESLPLMLNIENIATVLRISRAGAYKLVNSEGFPKVIENS